MDSDLRVLQARDADGEPFATMLNFSAHSTVLGSSNTLATGDWVQQTNPMLEHELGGKAMTMVGTLGRTQPNRPGCTRRVPPHRTPTRTATSARSTPTPSWWSTAPRSRSTTPGR